MRLSNSPVFTSLYTSKKIKISPQFHQLFRKLSDKILVSSTKTYRTLSSRQISPQSYSLPFQVQTKFFHAFSLQSSLPKSRKKS